MKIRRFFKIRGLDLRMCPETQLVIDKTLKSFNAPRSDNTMSQVIYAMSGKLRTCMSHKRRTDINYINKTPLTHQNNNTNKTKLTQPVK